MRKEKAKQVFVEEAFLTEENKLSAKRLNKAVDALVDESVRPQQSAEESLQSFYSACGIEAGATPAKSKKTPGTGWKRWAVGLGSACAVFLVIVAVGNFGLGRKSYAPSAPNYREEDEIHEQQAADYSNKAEGSANIAYDGIDRWTVAPVQGKLPAELQKVDADASAQYYLLSGSQFGDIYFSFDTENRMLLAKKGVFGLKLQETLENAFSDSERAELKKAAEAVDYDTMKAVLLGSPALAKLIETQ